MDKDNFESFLRSYRLELEKNFPGRTQAFWGKQTSQIVIIGQAPSQSGIRAQKPWFDKSGQKMRDEWFKVTDEVFYNQEIFYLTALGLYFPGKDKKGGDLKPSLDWAKEWASREVGFLRPKLFLIVGAMAAKFFFPLTEFERLIFEDQKLNNTPAVVLPHPSPANVKWFKDHPQFENRLEDVRRKISEIIKVYNSKHGNSKLN